VNRVAAGLRRGPRGSGRTYVMRSAISRQIEVMSLPVGESGRDAFVHISRRSIQNATGSFMRHADAGRRTCFRKYHDKHGL
jgi:hypothetical protein